MIYSFFSPFPPPQFSFATTKKVDPVFPRSSSRKRQHGGQKCRWFRWGCQIQNVSQSWKLEQTHALERSRRRRRRRGQWGEAALARFGRQPWPIPRRPTWSWSWTVSRFHALLCGCSQYSQADFALSFSLSVVTTRFLSARKSITECTQISIFLLLTQKWRPLPSELVAQLTQSQSETFAIV